MGLIYLLEELKWLDEYFDERGMEWFVCRFELFERVVILFYVEIFFSVFFEVEYDWDVVLDWVVRFKKLKFDNDKEVVEIGGVVDLLFVLVRVLGVDCVEFEGCIVVFSVDDFVLLYRLVFDLVW